MQDGWDMRASLPRVPASLPRAPSSLLRATSSLLRATSSLVCPGEATERRRLADRRHRPTPVLSRYTFRGRRRGARRVEEASGLYVDHISRTVAAALLLVFIFHCLDAVFTLAHIQRGGTELNPLMAHLIRIGPALFFTVKIVAAALGLLLLGLHQNFPHVKKGIGALFVIFLGVLVYHVYLITSAIAG